MPIPNNPGERNENELKKEGYTPRELVQRHSENPDEPITEEDMENLQLNSNTDDKKYINKMISADEVENIEKHTITTPLDILGE